MTNDQDQIIEEYRKRIEKYFPHFPIRTLVPLQPGWDSYVLEANGDTIFRFPLRKEVAQGLEKEICLLPVLAERLPVRVPCFELIARPESPDEYPFVGYPKITGVALSVVYARSPGFAAQTAHFLSALHGIPAEKAVELGIPRAGAAEWLQDYVDFYTWTRENIFSLLNPIERSAAAGMWEDYLEDPANFAFRSTLIHRDLGGEHILCDPRSATLTGVIDWGDACLGDPALDFVGLLLDGGREFVERVMEKYGGSLGGSFWQRAAFYCAIIPYYEIRFGMETEDEQHRRQGLALLQERLRVPLKIT